jgi:hypothetical protein
MEQWKRWALQNLEKVFAIVALLMFLALVMWAGTADANIDKEAGYEQAEPMIIYVVEWNAHNDKYYLPIMTEGQFKYAFQMLAMDLGIPIDVRGLTTEQTICAPQ